MSDPSTRHVPRPLAFSLSEAVIPPALPSGPTNESTTASANTNVNTLQMPFIRRHVMRRLKSAKATCDQELQKVIQAITTFFEERLREAERIERAEKETEESEIAAPVAIHADLRKAAQQLDALTDDAGYDAEPEAQPKGRHSRQASASSSPSSLRRPAPLPGAKATTPYVSSTGELSPVRKHSGNEGHPNTWSNTSGTKISRRLSRTIHIPPAPPRSVTSSRSTSRSRSPMPHTAQNSFSEAVSAPAPNSASPQASSSRRISRIEVDAPTDPFMSTLHEIIATCTDIIEMSVASLTSKPKAGLELVQRVQSIGKAWDENPDWPGQKWYVSLLLAVAAFSRVVEWWEAEKQFWNFEDDGDDDVEPLTFVLKPEVDGYTTPSMFPDDSGLRMSRTTSKEGRRSRDERAHRDFSAAFPLRHANEETKRQHEIATVELSRVHATEQLRQQAEEAQSLNIVLELNLDGEHLMWINQAWAEVVGTDPDFVIGSGISALLHPANVNAFRDATRQLQEDDSHTLEIRFKMKVEPEEDQPRDVGILYREMEGKGMLMLDRKDGQPSHTMWVIKPIAPPEPADPGILLDTGDIDASPSTPGGIFGRSSFHRRTGTDPVTPFPFSRPISTALIFCHICELQIPDWFFEKHSDTCNEVHKLEADIGECNESMAELRNTIREINLAIDRASPVSVPEYRGMPIFTPGSSTSAPIQAFRHPLGSRMKRVGVRKLQQRLLDQLDEILQMAQEISIPSLKEDQANEPIERQRLLSPSSENKVEQVQRWQKPSPDDPALMRLVQDADLLMRTKLENLIRMQNTIRYSEKVRQEWEEKVEQTLSSLENASGEATPGEVIEEKDESGSVPVATGAMDEEVEEEALGDGDASSTTSEYAFGRDATSDPTPMPAASPARSVQGGESGTTQPIAVPATYQGVGHTRSSTPTSNSSPLAIAAPIVAGTPESSSLLPPGFVESTGQTIRNRRSVQSLALEPRVMVTPPLSPMISPRDKVHRRHSTIHPILSPTSSIPGPLSPRIPSLAPASKTTPTSIKDFEIIKPISKGAFGSVFLAKKKVTGDYYAIKVLKKADMIAKNQITNVKAERMILMKQAESPFVVKLFFTFQSKDNLYLVMEYLNGGDCAALIKSLGCLPEEWTRGYIAEVVLGLEYLHERGVVHRDLKPDNLLIDQHGHLKLTDFGLSKIGLLGRQTRDTRKSSDRFLGANRTRSRHSPSSRPTSFDSAYLSSPLISADIGQGGSYFNARGNAAPHLPADDNMSESSGSESLSGLFRRRGAKPSDSPLQSFATELTNELRSHSTSGGGGTPPGEQKFVGTPDYLAPESILGTGEDDRAVDWWALGVITYEFLYGIPPFHAETPEKVFENIISGKIDWHEDWVDFSEEALDFMKSLMERDPTKRLGANGAREVKEHPFLAGIEWDKVMTSEAQFVPQVTDPESTDYFDPRGAIPQLFHDDDPVAVTGRPTSTAPTLPGADSPGEETSAHATTGALNITGREVVSPSPGTDDFGAFSFKNLPVLKQANDDVIRKLRTDQMVPITQTMAEPMGMHDRRRSLSSRVKAPQSVVTNIEPRIMTNPPSPSTSTSSIASSPSRGSGAPSTPGSFQSHVRRPSEYSAVERFKFNHMDGDGIRRNSLPSRLRTASVSSAEADFMTESWHSRVASQLEGSTPASSFGSNEYRKASDNRTSDRAVTCLLAEDNPISMKILETLLTRMGCRCVLVSDGAEAISVALGEIKFDLILMDYHMPAVDGEAAARYIKSTNNKNKSTPIIAVSAYSGQDANVASNLFAASLAKPVSKNDLLTVMRQLGFKTSTQDGSKQTKVAR